MDKKDTIKDFIGKSMLGKTARFVCNCTAHIDLSGTIVSYWISGTEIVFKVQTQEGKIYDIGENHPNMTVQTI